MQNFIRRHVVITDKGLKVPSLPFSYFLTDFVASASALSTVLFAYMTEEQRDALARIQVRAQAGRVGRVGCRTQAWRLRSCVRRSVPVVYVPPAQKKGKGRKVQFVNVKFESRIEVPRVDSALSSAT